MNDELIETMAIAMHDSDIDAVGESRGDNEYQRLARVALARAEAAGYRVVPVDPTPYMEREGARALCMSVPEAAEVYDAMIKAAPRTNTKSSN